jgi:hypothetical protein
MDEHTTGRVLGKGECGCPNLDSGWEYFVPADGELAEVLEDASRLEGQARIRSLLDSSNLDRATGKYGGGYRFGHSKLASGGGGGDAGHERPTRCKGCGQTFAAPKPQSRYCSRGCFADKVLRVGRKSRLTTDHDLVGRLLGLHRQGFTIHVISRELGVSWPTVKRWMRELGLRPARKSPAAYRPCRRCGKVSRSRNPRHCCRACKMAGAHRPQQTREGDRPRPDPNGAAWNRPHLPTGKTCLVCGGAFEPYYYTQVCCGVVCLARHEAARIREQVERVQRERCK